MTTFFQINDIVLDIPPLSIHIEESRELISRQVMRSEAPSIRPTAHSIPRVNFEIAFTSDPLGNEYYKLLNLVSQLRVTPFCYVENQYIRDAFSAQVGTRNMALAVERLSVEVVPDTDIVMVQINAFFFNYFPYLPDFTFIKDLGDSREVKDPIESVAFKLMYLGEQKRRSYLVPYRSGLGGDDDAYGNVLNHEVFLGATQFALISIEEYTKRKKEYDMITNVLSKMRLDRTATPEQEESTAETYFFNKLTESLGGDTEIDPRNLCDSILGNATSLGKAMHDPLTIEELERSLSGMVDENTYSIYQSVASKDWEIVTDKRGHPFVFPETLTPEMGSVDRSAPYGSNKTPTLSKNKINDANVKNLAYTTNNSATTKVLVKRKRTLRSHSGFIPFQVSVVIEYNLAIIPLVGHVYPTFQHMNGPSVVVNIAAYVKNGDSIGQAIRFAQTQADQVKHFRFIPQGNQTIEVVRQEILSMCGIRNLIYKDHRLQTMQDSSDTSILNLTFVETGLNPETEEQLRFEIRNPTDPVIISEIARHLYKLLVIDDDAKELKSDFSGITLYRPLDKFYAISPAMNSENKAIMKDILTEYAGILTDLMKRLAALRIMENESYSAQQGPTIVTENQQKARSAYRLLFGDVMSRLTWQSIPALVELRQDFYEHLQRLDREDRPDWLFFEKDRLGDDLLSYIDSIQHVGNSDRQIEYKAEVLRAKASIPTQQLSYLDPAVMTQELFGNYITKTVSLIRNKIILNGVIYEVEELKPYLAAIAQAKLGSSLNNYQDFPLPQILQVMRENENPVWNTYLAALDYNLTRPEYLFSNTDASVFIQPDFYMYKPPRTEGNFVTPQMVEAAEDYIQNSYLDRNDTEQKWLDGDYKNSVPPSRQEKLSAELQMRQGIFQQSSEALQNNKDSQMTPEDKDRKLKWMGAKVAHYNDLKALSGFDEGQARESVPLSTTLTMTCGGSTSDSYYGPIIVGEVSSTILDLLGKGRQSMSVYKNVRDANQVLKASNISSALRQSYGVPGRGGANNKAVVEPVAQQQANLGEVPNWTWPAEAGITRCPGPDGRYGIRKIHPLTNERNKPHKGIDITSIKPGESGGKKVLAAADGIIADVNTDPDKNRSGCTITLKHVQGWTSHYMHLRLDEKLQNLIVGATVSAGAHIANIGSTGGSTGPHLHFEVHLNGVHKPPKSTLTWQMSPPENFGWGLEEGVLDNTLNPTMLPRYAGLGDKDYITILAEQMNQKASGPQSVSFMRAYPAFRLYFIEDDSGERKRMGFDDFYHYSSVLEVQTIANKDIAADLAIIKISNVNGILSNRKFRYDKNAEKPKTESGATAKESVNILDADTAKETELASLMLQPGQHIQLKLGYDNNPDNLANVLTGIITDVDFSEGDEVVTVVCQTYAVELLQNSYGEGSRYGGLFNKSGVTGRILEDLLAAPELVHFGRWEGVESSPIDPEVSNSIRNTLTDRYTFKQQPADDNIFAPMGKDTLHGLLDFASTYNIYQSTIWDVFQEMTLRHPGTMSRALPYEGLWGPRMTMYFGLPDGLYISRDPLPSEQAELNGDARTLATAKEESQNKAVATTTAFLTAGGVGGLGASALVASIAAPIAVPLVAGATSVAVAYSAWQGFQSGLNWVSDENKLKIQSIQQDLDNKAQKLALNKKIIKPVRDYHILTSQHHILYNDIGSSLYHSFNTVTLQYSDDESEILSDIGALGFDDARTFTLSCDQNIRDQDKREAFAQFPNCVGYDMAKNYAVSLLKKTLGQGYRGTIIIIGNERIKPWDVCFIYDDVANIYGPIEVEQVVHRLSPGGGFITEITPNMLVHVNEDVSMATTEAMGLIWEHWLNDFRKNPVYGVGGEIDATLLQTYSDVAHALVSPVSPWAHVLFNGSEVAMGQNAVWNPLSMIGGFVFRKQITQSQLKHPFRYSLLVKDGHPLLGGIPASLEKDQGMFHKVNKWIMNSKRDIPLYVEDMRDKISLGNLLGYSQGDFWKSLIGD